MGTEKKDWDKRIGIPDNISLDKDRLSTTLPSDEEIDEIAFRRLLLTNRDANTELQDRMLIIDGLKIMRSLCEAKLAEMEREKPSLQDRLFTLANDFAVAKHGDIAVRLHSIHNSITTTT